MSDYTRANTDGATHFTQRDARSTGDADKVVVGAHFDAEYEAIVTAIATKYDSNDISSQAQAEGLTLDTVLLTPHTLNDVLIDNAGILKDLQALLVAGFSAADAVLGWDDSAGAAIGFTFTDGLAFGDGVITLEHLGFENLEDPGDFDRLLFWDATTDSLQWLQPFHGIETAGTQLRLADHAADVAVPITIVDGVFDIDLTSLTTLEGNALAATDLFYVNNGGVSEAIEYQGLGFIVQTGMGTQTLAAADMNTVMEFTATSTLTLPLNATTALPIGACILLNMKHATQELTITAAASVTLVSIHHPAGAAAASDTLVAGGGAVLIKTAADVWMLSGDITT